MEWNGTNIGRVSSSSKGSERKARRTHLSDVSVRYVRSPSDRHAKNLSLNCISACPHQPNRRIKHGVRVRDAIYGSNPRVPLRLAASKRNETWCYAKTVRHARRSLRTLTIRMRAMPAKSWAARALAEAEAESSPLPRRRWRRWRRRRRKREGSTSPSPAQSFGRDAAWPIRFGQVGEDEPRRRSGCGGAVGVRVDGEVGRVDARSPKPSPF
jgi:hypothetical protein